MHLMTALELKRPGIIFRGMVLMMQGLYRRACFFSIPSQVQDFLFCMLNYNLSENTAKDFDLYKIFCFVW